MEIVIWTIGAVFVLSFGFVVAFGPPYVPSRARHVKKAFDELYELKETDVLLDLGSGGGGVLRVVASRGAHAVGYELNPLLVVISNLLNRKYPNTRTIIANFMRCPFPLETTIIYIFGDSRDIQKIETRIQTEATRLKRPLHVLSYGFTLPHAKSVGHNGMHHLYIIEPLHGG